MRKNPYLLHLVLICLGLAVFFYFFMQSHDRYISAHEFEHYIISALMVNSSSYSEFIGYFQSSMPDKIIMIRSLPLMYIFGPTRFVFRYAAMLYNLALLVVFFFYINKVMSPKKSFVFALVFMFSYFFLELLNSPYVDLSFSIMCGILFVKLFLIGKNKRELDLSLAIIFFLMFLTKNTSYIFVPSIMVFFLLHLALEKKLSASMAMRFFLAGAMGFILYFAVLGFSLNMLANDIDVTVSQRLSESTGSLIGQFLGMMRYLLENVKFDLGFLLMFPNPILSLFPYGAALFFIFKKKHSFWTAAFLFSILFMFFYTNVLLEPSSEKRVFLPFYSIYLLMMFLAVSEWYDFKGNLIYFIEGGLLLLNITLLFFLPVPVFSIMRGEITTRINYDVLGGLPQGSTVYIDTRPYAPVHYFEGYSRIWDKRNMDKFGLMSKYDARFRYRMVDISSYHDYVLCYECRLLDLSGFSHVSTYNISGTYEPGMDCCKLELYKRNKY